MPRKSPLIRFAIVVAVVAACAAVSIVPRMGGDPDRMRVQALGGAWSVRDTTWRAFEGAWMVQALFYPDRVHLQKTVWPGILKSLCGSLLVKMPGAPNGVQRADVFRVTLNIVNRRDDQKTILPQDIPIQIVDGARQIKDQDKRYFPTCPGPLEAFFLFKVTAKKSVQKGLGIAVVFLQSDPSAKVTLDYLLACRGYVFDGMPGIDDALELADVHKRPDPLILKVGHQKQSAFGLLKTWRSQIREFTVVANTCIEMKGSDT